MIVAKSPRRLSTLGDQRPQVASRVTVQALYLSLAAGALLWASFPPLNLWLLAWIAPVPWLLIVRMPQPFTRWTYFAVWLGGFAHWLAMLQGIRLAHWALYFGWLALAWYLAFYTPIVVWLCRVAVHRLRMPLVVIAPLVWVGVELIRGHFLTGFSGGLLGHTQIAWASLLQVADLGGAYAVSFILAAVAAAVAQMVPYAWLGNSGPQAGRWSLWPTLPAAACVTAALAYGHYRLSETPPRADENPLRVALIQGSLDTVFDTSEDEYAARIQRTLAHYRGLTAEAVDPPGKLDLVVWPESAFPLVERRVNEPLHPLPDVNLSVDLLRERLTEAQQTFERVVRDAAACINDKPSAADDSGNGTYFLFGTNTLEYGPHEPRQYNSALLADPRGRVVDRYYKTHLVMFGEYIPFGEWLPWIYKWTPLPGGLDRGAGPVAMEVAGKRLSPCICFENFVPHLVRNQVTELTRRGAAPDVLVTVTNDGWFHGSSILDLHFHSAVFRAIENRRPMLIAANTGFSAHIDGSGRIMAVGPRRAPQVLLVTARMDGRSPFYHWVGDWPAILCAFVCGGLAVIGVWPRRWPCGITAPQIVESIASLGDDRRPGRGDVT